MRISESALRRVIRNVILEVDESNGQKDRSKPESLAIKGGSFTVDGQKYTRDGAMIISPWGDYDEFGRPVREDKPDLPDKSECCYDFICNVIDKLEEDYHFTVKYTGSPEMTYDELTNLYGIERSYFIVKPSYPLNNRSRRFDFLPTVKHYFVDYYLSLKIAAGRYVPRGRRGIKPFYRNHVDTCARNIYESWKKENAEEFKASLKPGYVDYTWFPGDEEDEEDEDLQP